MFKIKYFKSLEGVYKHYGEENVVPITNIKQVIYYTTICEVQPLFVKESDITKGNIVCFFNKDETKKYYESWMQARPDKKCNRK